MTAIRNQLNNASQYTPFGHVRLTRGRHLVTLFAFTESQMPVGRPRSLGAPGYADVIAYILAANGFPDGQQELPAVGSVLDKIVIDKKK